MKSLTRRLLATAAALGTIAVLAGGPGLSTGAYAQSARDGSPTPLLPIQNEPAPKLIADAPLPGPLARGVVIIQYRAGELSHPAGVRARTPSSCRRERGICT